MSYSIKSYMIFAQFHSLLLLFLTSHLVLTTTAFAHTDHLSNSNTSSGKSNRYPLGLYKHCCTYRNSRAAHPAAERLICAASSKAAATSQSYSRPYRNHSSTNSTTVSGCIAFYSPALNHPHNLRRSRLHIDLYDLSFFFPNVLLILF